MFKPLLILTCAAAALFPITSASAATTTDPLAKWVAQVNKQIDMHMQTPIGDGTGLARVSFRRGEDGHAVDIVVESGPRSVAKAAARTARLLQNLPPLPAGMPADQRIVMNILIGGPGMSVPYDLQRERLLAAGTAANARLASTLGTSQVALLDRR